MFLGGTVDRTRFFLEVKVGVLCWANKRLFWWGGGSGSSSGCVLLTSWRTAREHPAH